MTTSSHIIDKVGAKESHNLSQPHSLESPPTLIYDVSI